MGQGHKEHAITGFVDHHGVMASTRRCQRAPHTAPGRGSSPTPRRLPPWVAFSRADNEYLGGGTKMVRAWSIESHQVDPQPDDVSRRVDGSDVASHRPVPDGGLELVEADELQRTQFIDCVDLALGQGLAHGAERVAAVGEADGRSDLAVALALDQELHGSHALHARECQRLHSDLPGARHSQ